MEKEKFSLTFWEPNKQTKETTIQVNTTKSSDKRFVNMFSDQFIRPVINRVANGIGIGNFFKKLGNTKLMCDICKNSFIFKTDLKDHKIKKHHEKSNKFNKISSEAENKEKKSIPSIKCDICDFTAESNTSIDEHIENVHNNFWLVDPKRRKKDKEPEKSVINDKNNDEEKRLQSLMLGDNKKQTKLNLNKRGKLRNNTTKKIMLKKIDTTTQMDIDTNIKELPPSVKCLYPESFEFVVPGNGACCLNCLAAFIYLDSKEGPALGRDLNTHIVTYRPEYLKILSFPRSDTIGY